MNDVLVSCIITTYNRKHLLIQAIESVLEQSYKHIELLVVDDNPTNSSYSEVKQAFPNDERIEYHCMEKNSGVLAARNFGVNIARGEFVAFLDDDDTWHPSKIATQVEYSSDYELISCLASIDTGSCLVEQKLTNMITEQGFLDVYRNSRFIYPSGLLMSRSLFLQCGGFDIKSVEHEFFLRVLYRHEKKVYVVPEHLVYFNRDPSLLRVSRNMRPYYALLAVYIFYSSCVPNKDFKERLAMVYHKLGRNSTSILESFGYFVLSNFFGNRSLMIEMLKKLIGK